MGLSLDGRGCDSVAIAATLPFLPQIVPRLESPLTEVLRAILNVHNISTGDCICINRLRNSHRGFRFREAVDEKGCEVLEAAHDLVRKVESAERHISCIGGVHARMTQLRGFLTPPLPRVIRTPPASPGLASSLRRVRWRMQHCPRNLPAAHVPWFRSRISSARQDATYSQSAARVPNEPRFSRSHSC